MEKGNVTLDRTSRRRFLTAGLPAAVFLTPDIAAAKNQDVRPWHAIDLDWFALMTV